jgi:hypothetical protein
MGTSFGGSEVSGITFNMHHVPGNVADDGFGMSGTIIKQLGCIMFDCVLQFASANRIALCPL